MAAAKGTLKGEEPPFAAGADLLLAWTPQQEMFRHAGEPGSESEKITDDATAAAARGRRG